MQDFFDRFKPKTTNTKSNNNNNNSNPLGNLFGGGTKTFSGEGKSLGGTTKPGKVLSITLSEPGQLGMAIEGLSNTNSNGKPGPAYAIVGHVVPNSQADRAGLQRGDILCFAGSNGKEEILHSLFIELAKSNQRPLCFEVRRIETTAQTMKTASSANNDRNKNSTNVGGNHSKVSAEAYAKKQAMIAAAEAREKKFKQITKPIKTGFVPKTKATTNDNDNDNSNTTNNNNLSLEPTSEEAKRAMQYAKENEMKTVAALGYNPYEVNTVSAGTARNAVTTTTYGAIEATTTTNTTTTNTTLPSIVPPSDPAVSSVQQQTSLTTNNSNNNNATPVPIEFEQAFEIFVTTNTDHDAVTNSISIMIKLITNATTKDDIKFRKVRLNNPKIQSAIVNMHGVIDLLFLIGFQLLTEENCTTNDNDDTTTTATTNENILVYPTSKTVPEPWLASAIQMMQQYINTNK